MPGQYPETVYFVPVERRAIALTIDDGLDPATTPLILDVLEKHGAKATFFVLSDSLTGQRPLIDRLLREGHELGHHMTEDRVTVRLDDEALNERFDRAADALEQITPVAWFRPGSGRYDDRVLALVHARGYRMAMASVAPIDTWLRSSRWMAAYVNWMVQPGSIVVLHDAGARGRRTVATLERLLPRLSERGYDVLSLTGLDSLADG